MGPGLSAEPLQKHFCFFDAFSYGIEGLPFAHIHNLYLTSVKKTKEEEKRSGAEAPFLLLDKASVL